jgi:hypothetical protein
MLYAKSIQSIKNFDDKETVNKEMKFEVDSIENVYRLCQGTLAAYPPVTGQGRLNGWVS